MKVFAFCLLVACITTVSSRSKHPCDEKDCKAGRECVVVDGKPQCLCQISCPPNLKPVCGSDGVTYDNHCRLHQKACMSGDHISISHKGHCKRSEDKTWKSDSRKSLLGKDDLKRELENDLIDHLVKKKTKEPSKEPAACFGPQRESLRFLLVKYWEKNQKNQPWFTNNMGHRESQWGWFFSCNTDKDNRLSPEELLICSQNVTFYARPGQDKQITKALCIDALVEDGDKDEDSGLNFQEFTRIFNVKYRPVERKCVLEGKNYFDGEDVHVGCNHCICAVGHWVCTSTDDCKEKKTPLVSAKDSEDEFDNFIDESDPLEATDVADLWLETAKMEKQRAKTHKQLLSHSELDVQNEGFEDLENEKVDDASDLENKNELDQTFIDDDLLFEKTKSKHQKKNIFTMEKALKKLNALTKQTEELKALLGLSKPKLNKGKFEKSGGRHHWLPQNNHPERQKQKEKKKSIKHSISDKKTKEFYDKIYKNTKWNELIDWGEFGKKEKLHSKKFPLEQQL